MPDNDASKVGQDRQYQTPNQQYDAEHGTYRDNVEGTPDNDRFPIGELPQAPDPTPHRIGGGGNGGGGQ